MRQGRNVRRRKPLRPAYGAGQFQNARVVDLIEISHLSAAPGRAGAAAILATPYIGIKDGDANWQRACDGMEKHDLAETIETSRSFTPRFGADGLIPAIVTAHGSSEVLMFAHMNAEALSLTLTSGIAHFWSRSRGKLWKKGEESGNLLHVREVRTDCDQDVVWLSVDVAGDGVACHTGERSCFYRRLAIGATRDGKVTLEPAALPNSAAAD